jgi:adenylate cyclase
MTSLPSAAIDHFTWTLPPLTDNAPYFTALVVNSCRATAIDCADLGFSSRSGPTNSARDSTSLRDKEGADAIAAFNAARVRQGGVPFVMLELKPDDSRYKPPPASPLVRGLLRLGVPENYDSPAFDSLRLTAREIESLFFGHRVQGRTLLEGAEWGASVALDGTAVRYGVWGTGAGVAKVEGDRLCFVLSTTSRCGSILRNPGGTRAKENEYLWFFGWVAPFSQIE